MNTLDPDVLLRVVDYVNMSDIAQLRATCASNRYLFCSYSGIIGQALVNQYGAYEGVEVAFKHCHEKVALWICRNFTSQLNWYEISEFQVLSEDFIREFKDSVGWLDISMHQKLSGAFIKEFQDKVYWNFISQHQKLSETFIREFKDKVGWFDISEHQELSEAFIEEFQDKVCWGFISKYQKKVSDTFIEEIWSERIWKEIWEVCSQTKNYSEEYKKECREKFSDEISCMVKRSH